MNVDLNEKDILALKESVSNDTHSNLTNKRKPDGNRKKTVENSNIIVFPAFDISTKCVGLDNSNAQVTTIGYEIRCHPYHANLLKTILIQVSVLDPIAPSERNFHFIPYGLIQTIDSTTIKNQIIQQNRFLTQTGIVHILNITTYTMDSGLKERLLSLPSVIGLELNYLIGKSGKWLVVVKSSQKEQARNNIDQIINDTIFLESQVETAGRFNRHNINSVLVTYTAALQKKATPTTIHFQNPPQYAVKRHIRVSYDLGFKDAFPTTGNKIVKPSKKY